jgi:cytochrome P450
VIQRAHLASRNGQGIAKNILQSYRNNNKKQNHSTSFAKGTVIEYIVMNPQYQNDAERIADILVFLVGGHDTTAYTIAWTLLELARHPNEMEHVRNELSNLTSEEERLKCPALDHVIRESMRLHPVAANILREVHRDFHVDDETVIPKGSVVFLMNILIHRHPQYFDQPDQFMPSRWKDNNNNSNNNNNTVFAAFAPFALGARNCVGQALAQAELHTVLARFIMDYDFEVEDPGKAECTLTLKPSGLKLKARTKQ